ncbi:PTS sugar transporter subunit IIC [Enterococcus rivorum]|uniref:Permease IIC component n=2 Tax=Enterococcus rivorum TaxID=762845 RepID=A0A1E5KVW0_9ENTE|nr:PTS transporter subunit EIIC [Enterococcus rivorum]MBP2099006.1 PTS system cellobiose-specific IIC component [Enterococcus rivorum]OEH81978.1 PTS lactose/cellobiose family IIC subunit [Enterococcus rivorum]
MMDKLTEKIMPKAMKISQNKYLGSVSDGFMSLMPVLIIGSIFSLLNNLAIPSYQNFIESVGLKAFFSIPNLVTNDIISIYAVFFIAYFYAKRENVDQGVAGMVALFSFLAVVPMGNAAATISAFLTENNLKVAEDVVLPAGNYIPFEWIGAKGLFVAIFVALISAKIYSTMINKKMMIKMPESVPPTISKSFGGLLPGFVSILFFIGLDRLVSLIPIEGVTGIQTGIYSFIQAPMEAFLGNNVWSFIFAIFLCQILWSLGIHGMSAIILPLFYPLWTALNNANMDALNSGTSAYELPNILNRSFWSVYVILGGSGMTIGLCLLMLFVGKSKQYKTLGKLSIVANLCGINEPIIFGFPLVLNPFMIVPFIVTPIISAVLAYLLTLIDILPRLSYIIPLGTPVIMSGFISTPDGGWKVALFQIVMILFSGVMYYPFFKMLDKKAYQEELGN